METGPVSDQTGTRNNGQMLIIGDEDWRLVFMCLRMSPPPFDFDAWIHNGAEGSGDSFWSSSRRSFSDTADILLSLMLYSLAARWARAKKRLRTPRRSELLARRATTLADLGRVARAEVDESEDDDR